MSPRWEDHPPKVVLLVISQEARPTLEPCLESLLTLDYPNYEIFLVAHHTVSPEWAGRHRSFPSLTIVQTPRPLGIASARNFGMAQIENREVDYLFHLDNDLLVGKDCLRALVSTAQSHPQAALIAPKILQKNGLILSNGGRYLRAIGQPILLDQGKEDRPPAPGGIRPIDFATGAIGLVRKSLLTQVGAFDTRFDPYGFEDIDWCLRIGKAGWKLVLDERARVIHLSDYSFHQASPARLYETTRKRAFLAKKHLSPTAYHLLFLPYFFLRRSLMVILKLAVQRRWYAIPAVVQATREILTAHPTNP
jgi:GT2 family glycosyltransferase